MSASHLGTRYRVPSLDGVTDAVLVRNHDGELLYDLGRGIGLMIAVPDDRDARPSKERPVWPNVSGNDFYFIYDRYAYRPENTDSFPGLPPEKEAAERGELSQTAETFFSLRAPADTFTVGQINSLVEAMVAVVAAAPIHTGAARLRFGGPVTHAGPVGNRGDDDPQVISYLIELAEDSSISPLERGLALMVNDGLKKLFGHAEIIAILSDNGVFDYLNDDSTPAKFVPGNLLVQPEFAVWGRPNVGGSELLVNRCDDRDRLAFFFALKNRIVQASRAGSEASQRASKLAAIKAMSSRILGKREFSYYPGEWLNDRLISKLTALTPAQLLDLFLMVDHRFTAAGLEFVIDSLTTKKLSGRNDYPFLTSQEVMIADSRVDALALECGETGTANYAALSLIPAALVKGLSVDETTFIEAGLLVIEAQKADFFPDEYATLLGELLEQYVDQNVEIPFTWFTKLNSLNENSGLDIF